MRILTTLLLLSVLFLFSYGQKDIPHCNFKFEHFKSLNGIPEPSDIVYDSASNHYYIVSDHGMLFECDLQGNIIRKANEEGQDFEGVEIKDSFVYVSDETPRKVYKYRKRFIQYRGAVRPTGLLNLLPTTILRSASCWYRRNPSILLNMMSSFMR